MCELLGMSANVPTDICFSFSGLLQRGGNTGPHSDGWGVAFYTGKGMSSFHEPHPSSESKIARFVSTAPIKSHIVISHIRQANVGEIALENTHPFTRELWGRYWTFAHNGQLDKGLFSLQLGDFNPVGSTDSEHAFCWLLHELRAEFPTEPRGNQIAEFLQSRCDRLAGMGVFNMLLTDSESLFAYCSTKLHWLTRKAPFGQATLADAELSVDFSELTSPNDVVTTIATEPLTGDEQWTAFKTGELLWFKGGLLCNGSL